MTPYASTTGWLGRGIDASGYQSVAMSLPISLVLRGKQSALNRYPSWLPTPDSLYYQSLLPL